MSHISQLKGGDLLILFFMILVCNHNFCFTVLFTSVTLLLFLVTYTHFMCFVSKHFVSSQSDEGFFRTTFRVRRNSNYTIINNNMKITLISKWGYCKFNEFQRLMKKVLELKTFRYDTIYGS